MARTLRLGFLSHHNPLDRRSFSGTAFYMLRALQAAPGVTVRVLGRHRAPGPLPGVMRRVLPRPAIRARDIDERDLDFIVSLTSSDLLDRVGAGLRTPLVHVTDATPAFLRDFYGHEIPPEIDAREARVIGLARHVVYSSDYMARRGAAEFGAAAGQHMHAVPFGINLDRLPPDPGPKPALDPLRLLFVGKNWQRKGGEVALEMLRVLADRGVDARLQVIGCEPEVSAPGFEVLGYLDKNRPEDMARLDRAFAAAHLFVLPTRADCTPMVVAEANAYGCPVLITDVGGIGSLMAEGANGRMLPLAATGADFADAVQALTADRAAYDALCRSARAHCHDRLTWDAWARGVTDILHRDLEAGT